MTKTNEEKNPVIASKVRIEPTNLIINNIEMEELVYPDFFKPMGQVRLAKALFDLRDSKDPRKKMLFIRFTGYLKEKTLMNKSAAIIEVIAETKLAELFYEFIESEK